MVQIWIHNSIFLVEKQNFFNISKLSSCEKNILKFFINILKTYGLDQQRASNIKGVVDKKHKFLHINKNKEGILK
jgi:hypothetical protein